MWPTLPRITPAAKIRGLDEDGRARYVIEKERAEQVRAGSAAGGQTTDNSGHERLLDVSQDRRSLHLRASDLV